MTHLSYQAARRALERGETSCVELVSSFLRQIEADNDRLNIFLFVDADGALARARALDAEIAAGTWRPLTGMVVSVKDVICMKDQQVTCGSHILEGFRSLYDATAIERLREAGAILIGKVNCDEFAMGSSNENSYFGPVRNPVNPEYVPGGSSGASAASVAAGMCHASLGSDTGGSVRQPASFCGVVGLKPTYGRISRYGLVAYASSFDCIGPFGRSVDDVAGLLQAMAGHDRWDATSAPAPVPDYSVAPETSLAGLRIGLPIEYFAEGLDPAIRNAVEQAARQFEAEGATVTEVSLPHTEFGIATYYVLTTAEASSNLARYDGVRYGYRATTDRGRRTPGQESALSRMYVQSRSEGFGEEVKRRIMLGTYVLSSGYYEAYYGKAQRVRTLIRQDFERAFEQVDVLFTPATPAPAFRLGSKTSDPLEMYLGDVYTVTANLAGIPGLVVPIGTHPEGLPLGLQILGKHFDEQRILQVGHTAMRRAGTVIE